MLDILTLVRSWRGCTIAVPFDLLSTIEESALTVATGGSVVALSARMVLLLESVGTFVLGVDGRGVSSSSSDPCGVFGVSLLNASLFRLINFLFCFLYSGLFSSSTSSGFIKLWMFISSAG